MTNSAKNLRYLNQLLKKQYRILAKPIRRVLKSNRDLSQDNSYRPIIPVTVDNDVLDKEMADYFSLTNQEVESRRSSYLRLHNEKDYSVTLGERKTLSQEEAYVIYNGLLQVDPTSFVEIGTQYGKSTRRILDMIQFIGIDCKVTCFDVHDDLEYVSHVEVKLILKDITNDVRGAVFENLNPKLIFLDAHPYQLLFNVISEFLKWSLNHPCILAIHDCSPGLFNPNMHVAIDDPWTEITSQTGVWERHVLAEVFDARDAELDDLRTVTHRLRIFSTPHGLALIAPLTQLT